MPHSSKETVALAWCDGGMVDGRFMDGLLLATMNAPKIGMNIVNKIRVNGNQIGRQRQVLFDNWADVTKTDWLLWIDSDIEWDPSDFIKLYNSDLPIISGLYQLDPVGSVAVGLPNKNGVPTRVNKVEFLLQDEPVEVGGVGFGFLAVKTGVFEDLPRPWFLIAKIQWDPTRDLRVNMGEDYSWCELAKANGYKIWLDPTVKVRHHKETVYEI
jgi:hypothetical protein